MEAFGKFCFAIIGVVIATILGGFVLTKLWGWFIVSVFNLPQLTIIQAIGVSIVVGYFKNTRSKTNEKEKEFGYALLEAIVISALWLLFGWVIHLFF